MIRENMQHWKMILETLQTLEEKGILKEDEEVVQSNIDYDKVDKLLINLPKFSPTENWGDPNHVDREEIDKLMKTFRRGAGGKDGVREAIRYFQRIQMEGTRITSPRRILRSIIALEILSMIIKGFGASAAGFVFEAFIAAMLGGKQVTETREDGGLPITDVVGFSETKSGKVALSLKLLSDKRDTLTDKGKKGGAISIHGSFKNLIEEIDQDDVVVYLIAYKHFDGEDAERIKIGSFEFNRENIIDVLTIGKAGKELCKISNPEKLIAVIAAELAEEVPNTEPAEINEDVAGQEEVQSLSDEITDPEDNPTADPRELAIQYITSRINKDPTSLTHEDTNIIYKAMLSEFGGATAMNVLRSTDGYGRKAEVNEGSSSGDRTQWSITAAQYYGKLPQNAYYEDYGEISFSENAIRETVAIHINNIRDTLITMLESLRLITEETNKYLLTQNRSTANNAGARALKNAKNYEDSLSNQLQDDTE